MAIGTESKVTNMDLGLLQELFHELSHSKGVFCQVVAAALQKVINARQGCDAQLASAVRVDKQALRRAIGNYDEFSEQTDHLLDTLKRLTAIPPLVKSWIWSELFTACADENEALEGDCRME